MNFKTCTLSLAALLLAASAIAQDEIHKRNGSVIEGKVVEIGTKTISYKKASNPDGPNYVIDKTDVSKIVYENGKSENINAGGPRRPMPPGFNRNNNDDDAETSYTPKNYGNNIIAFSPMQLTDEGAGVGITYERVLDKSKNFLSFYMPVSIAFKRLSSGNPSGDAPTYYFMPGIKFYPTGGKGVVRYGLGANLVYATGRETYEVFSNNGMVTQFVTDDFYKLGMIVNNSLNVNPTDHLHFGLEFGLGFPYIDESDNNFNDGSPLVQFGFKVGYRF